MESEPDPDRNRKTRAEAMEALTTAGFADYLKLIPNASEFLSLSVGALAGPAHDSGAPVVDEPRPDFAEVSLTKSEIYCIFLTEGGGSSRQWVWINDGCRCQDHGEDLCTP